jgi:hypothetical protein
MVWCVYSIEQVMVLGHFDTLALSVTDLYAPGIYMYSLMLFAVDNMHYLPTISPVHEINARYNNQLQRTFSYTICYTQALPILLLGHSTNYQQESQN